MFLQRCPGVHLRTFIIFFISSGIYSCHRRDDVRPGSVHIWTLEIQGYSRLFKASWKWNSRLFFMACIFL